MTPRSLVALLAAAALAPAAASSDDGDWGEPSYGPSYSDGYDVDVDLNDSGAVTFDTFQGALSPYGEWVQAANHGPVWRPRVAAGWRPYYYGRWEWTNEGWLWVSDEPWGWAAYHYGRWTYDSYYGWVWVPGYEWAPAWVSWRVSGDVVGWAPLAPGFSLYVSSYPFVDFWWTFVPTVRFVSVPVYTVAYAPSHTHRWYQHTAPAPARPAPRAAPGRAVPAPAPAWGGPAPRLISERIGRPLAAARIVAAPAPGARGRPGEVPVYRPHGRPAAPGRGRGFESRPPPPGRDGMAFSGDDRGGRGRGPGVAPAPGWRGGDDDRNGRGPGPAPAQGWTRGGRGGDRDGAASAPPRGEGNGGSGPAMGPPRGSGNRGGDRDGNRGGDREGNRGGDRGGDRGGSMSAPPRGGNGGGHGGSGAPPSRGGGGGSRGGGSGGRGGGGERSAPHRG